MFNIRPLQAHEWPRFKELYRSLVAETSFLIHEPDELQCPRSLPERDLKQSPILIAETATGWIGYLSFMRGCTRRTHHRGDLSMAVRRGFHRQGIGRSLLHEIETWARKADVSRIELSVIALNTAAVRLYQSEGYLQEGVKKNALLIGGLFLDGFLMSKTSLRRAVSPDSGTAAQA